MTIMGTDEVRALVKAYKNAHTIEGRARLKAQLDNVANKRRFTKEIVIIGESGADTDNAIDSISSFGADSYNSYRRGDWDDHH